MLGFGRNRIFAAADCAVLDCAERYFCGSAIRQPLPSSGRKVSRVSVTEGACGTERRRKTERFAFSFSRLRRQLPLGGSLWLCVFFSPCRRGIFFLFFGAFQTIPHPLRASRPYRKEAMSWCDFFLCDEEQIFQHFGKYRRRFSESHKVNFCGISVHHKVNPLSASRQPPLSQQRHGFVRFSMLYRRKTKPLRQPQQPPFVKGGCCFVKATGARVDTVSENRFSDFSLPQSGRSPLFCGFSPQSEGFPIPFRAARTESAKQGSGFRAAEVSSAQRITSTPIYLRSTSGTVTLPSAF